MRLSRPDWAHVRRDGDGRWRVGGTLLAVLATVVALVAILVHAVPTTWQPMIVLAAGAHYPMWAAPVAVVLALLVRRWATLLIAALLTVLVLVVQVPTWISESVPAHGTPITEMQANLRLGSADPAAVVALVRSNDVDLLATEELTYGERERLIRAGLSSVLPYHYTVPSPDGGNGIGMWSRYPLSQQRLAPGFELKVVTAHVTLPGGKAVTFAAVHLLPPYPYAPGEWSRELDRLHTLLRALPGSTPVVAAGDYNATVDHAQFRELLDAGYADAADQAGAGYPATYPADRWTGPLIAIDHVLTRGGVATTLDTVDLPNSDHRGLLARIMLRTGS